MRYKMKLVNVKRVTVQTREQDVESILNAVTLIDPLEYGIYDRNAYIKRNCTSIYKPKEGSTTHIHLAQPKHNIQPKHNTDSVELTFDVSGDLENVLQAVIDNPNRWYNQ